VNCSSAFLILALTTAGSSQTPTPRDAVSAILEVFEHYPIVAIGEDHRHQQIHDFIVSLVTASNFPGRVNDIVVEFGAARYQGLMDRYIAGETVSLDQLRQVWRDTVNILVWDAPIYQRFFETVRSVNQRLPQSRRLRVLLGDPDFDWRQVHTRRQWERIARQRDAHAWQVVENEVFVKHRRALLVFGSGHLNREGAYDRVDRKPQTKFNLTETIEKNHPRTVFVIWPHTGNWGAITEVDARLASWPAPALALLKGTWLGATAIGEPGTSPPMQELADALLYLGTVASERYSKPPDTLYADPAYLRELLRRDRIQGGFNRTELQRLARSRVR
jgi:hypothetical protein